jgi:hypothetical protein
LRLACGRCEEKEREGKMGIKKKAYVDGIGTPT